MVRSALRWANLVAASLLVIGQVSAGPPKFESYPATVDFHSVGARPQITTPEQWRYRTRIRDGVEKGWGVFHHGREGKPGPNFAGNMIVIQWGCGAPCLMMSMVDGRTGEIYNPPLALDNTFALPLLSIGCCSPGTNAEVEFRQDSRLMVISASPKFWLRHHRSYRHYIVWQDDHWILVYKEPLD